MPKTILIVDDDPVQRRLLENAITKMGFEVEVAIDGLSALSKIKADLRRRYALIVLDLMMPELDGMGVLKELKQIDHHYPIIVQTAQGGIETVVNAIRAGAIDFCVKPVSFERLKVSIDNALQIDAMKDVVQKVKKTTAGQFTFDDLIAQSSAMAPILKMGRRAAVSNIPVLLEGESGVGKEVIARAIQGSSDRASKPFVIVNCGAIPENLVESILFGHEKGAFTGAAEKHVGKFKEADGGTLFLDEVGELSLDIQVKLLRAIQEGEVDPIGSKHPVKTDFRLISATNRDMADLVKSGQFREDLFYRLNVFPITLPPLRERNSDISELVRHFTTKFCLEEGRQSIKGIHFDALTMLESFEWPGNIRQLENTVFRAVILCEGDELTVEDFPQIAARVPTLTTNSEPSSLVSFADETPAVNPRSSDDLHFVHGNGTLKSLEDLEAEAIQFALEHHAYRMTDVAKSLKIGRSTLYRKLREYKIDHSGDIQSPDAA